MCVVGSVASSYEELTEVEDDVTREDVRCCSESVSSGIIDSVIVQKHAGHAHRGDDSKSKGNEGDLKKNMPMVLDGLSQLYRQ
mmetsp:Transcript_56999/g.65292  ORF Transcript_56999/g.65292 Transcript_56999/m.65292 type:complete len:83 (-) Transcript_56999:84-332(-)